MSTHYLLQFFEVHDRLREDLKPTSELFHAIAHEIHGLSRQNLQTLGEEALRVLVVFYQSKVKYTPNPEVKVTCQKLEAARNILISCREDVSCEEILDVVLRPLLEAKDCAVRAVLYKEPQ